MDRILIDLFSDTITGPTPGIRKFMNEAEVGDEQQKEDPVPCLDPYGCIKNAGQGSPHHHSRSRP